MKLLEDVLTFKIINIVHDTILKISGGAEGVQNRNMILSSLGTPFSSYGGYEFYPNLIEKAGILFYSIIKNHGFVDGNKRTACLMLVLALQLYGYELTATNLSIEKMALDIAENKVSKNQLFLWICHNIGVIRNKKWPHDK